MWSMDGHSPSKAGAKLSRGSSSRELSPHCVDISETAGVADTPVSLVMSRDLRGSVEQHGGIQILRAGGRSGRLVNFGGVGKGDENSWVTHRTCVRFDFGVG